MSFLSAFDISASGLTAQRQRLDVAAENISNANTTRTESGGPYRRKIVSLQEKPNYDGSFLKEMRTRFRRDGMPSKGGVRVSAITEDQRDLQPIYRPGHPDANEQAAEQVSCPCRFLHVSGAGRQPTFQLK